MLAQGDGSTRFDVWSKVGRMLARPKKIWIKPSFLQIFSFPHHFLQPPGTFSTGMFLQIKGLGPICG
jgi:hypothetical protein